MLAQPTITPNCILYYTHVCMYVYMHSLGICESDKSVKCLIPSHWSLFAHHFIKYLFYLRQELTVYACICIYLRLTLPFALAFHEVLIHLLLIIAGMCLKGKNESINKYMKSLNN